MLALIVLSIVNVCLSRRRHRATTRSSRCILEGTVPIMNELKSTNVTVTVAVCEANSKSPVVKATPNCWSSVRVNVHSTVAAVTPMCRRRRDGVLKYKNPVGRDAICGTSRGNVAVEPRRPTRDQHGAMLALRVVARGDLTQAMLPS